MPPTAGPIYASTMRRRDRAWRRTRRRGALRARMMVGAGAVAGLVTVLAQHLG